MEESVHSRKLSPEVALIGALLIVAGIAEAIYGFAVIRSILMQHGNGDDFLRQIAFGAGIIPLPLPLAEFGIILRAIIFVAVLVCGVALLRRASWGLRGAQITLIALIGLALVSGLVNHIIFPLYLYLPIGLNFAVVKTGLITFLISIFKVLPYVIMLLFLSPTRAAESPDKDRQPGRLQALADRFHRLLPADVTPVFALVGLLLISHAIPALFTIHNSFEALTNLSQSYQGLGGSDIGLTHTDTWFALVYILKILIIAFPVCAIIGCLAIFTLKKRALPIVLVVLLICCADIIIPLYSITLYLGSIDSNLHALHWPMALDLIPALIVPLSEAAAYVVMGIFLVRYRNEAGNHGTAESATV